MFSEHQIGIIDDRPAIDVERPKSAGAAIRVESRALLSQADGVRLIHIDAKSSSVDTLTSRTTGVRSSGSGQMDRVHQLCIDDPCFAEGKRLGDLSVPRVC